jgi:hypothetical protein
VEEMKSNKKELEMKKNKIIPMTSEVKQPGMLLNKVSAIMHNDDIDSSWLNHNENRASYFIYKNGEYIPSAREAWEDSWIRWFKANERKNSEIS